MHITAIIAIILAYIIKGMSGFANTLIFGTIMSFTINNIKITPVELIVSYPSNIIIAWKERKGIKARVWIPLSVLVIIGSIPGALFLKSGDTHLIKTLFGFVVVFIGIEMLLRERQKINKKSSKGSLMLIGIVSGILCGLFGIGAFLVAYISRTTENQNQFRGNICIVFLVENTFRIILYSLTGILNIAILKDAIMLIPFMIIALFIGISLSKMVSEAFVKKIIIILLVISGISLIMNNINFS